MLWGRDARLTDQLAQARTNQRYLPGIQLPPALGITSDLGGALSKADLVLIATPVSGLRASVQVVHESRPGLPLLWACKGFEEETAFLPHQIVDQVAPGLLCGTLTGPSFAQEVARGLPAAVTLASRDTGFAQGTARELHQSTLRIYYAEDLVGAEVAGAVKNVMAIATGVCEGLGLGLNARAALITRGLAEISRLGMALGGRQDTFMGLAGAGDLILTCTGDLSRNRSVGLELARGRTLDETLAHLGHVAEGVHSAREAARLAARLGVEMPITMAVCSILFEGRRPSDAARELLARDPKIER